MSTISQPFRAKGYSRIICSLLMILVVIFVVVPGPLSAQEEEPQIQVLTGRLSDGEIMHYLLADLQQGDTLYVEISNVSGNLDPAALLMVPDTFTEELLQQMRAEVAQRAEAGEDPMRALREVILANVLVGNDNFGASSAAAFAYEIPEDGDYLLLALEALTNETAGEYRLVVGINAPDILTGQGRSTGAQIAVLDEEASGIATAVQEIQGKLTTEQHNWFYDIPHVNEGDTFYAYVEATSGDLRPQLELRDYSGRTVSMANANGQQTFAALERPVGAQTENHRLVVTACCADTGGSSGEYRLLIGTNEPLVLSGEATPSGRPLVVGPQTVTVRAELHQITGVDQKAENYGGVYYIQLDWHDPTQAFNPDECLCNFKTFLGPGFNKLVSDENLIWPSFNIANQQDNRWIQNQGIVVQANGNMTYFERFTTTLQAPDFNFRAFPFDTQQFYLHIDSLFPQTFFQFEGPIELSEVGPQLGEEEWQVTEYSTETSNIDGIGQVPNSRFSFGFRANRHLNFYIMRIFVPTILIIVVSYFTFFLKDYSKRIDVTSANLLVFVAFNFTISNELPRLGYLTFLDAMLASVFVVTALMVAFNVYLRRLELNGKEERARKIDSYTLWVYPMLYLIGGVVLTVYFLLPEYWSNFVAIFS